MNFRALEYLIALDEQNGFHKAAKTCNVSQPALSIQIRKLEEELDLQLLERSPKGFFFTEAGKDVVARARLVVQQVSEMEQLSEVWNDPYSGQISIGAFPTLAPYYFPQIIDHLVETYPELKVNLIEEKTSVLLERLNSGEIDAAFLALPEDEPLLEHGEIFEEPFYVGVATTHPFANRKTMTPDELAKENLMLLEEGHCLRGQALEFCSTAGIGSFIDFRASSMETLLQMISMGRAVSLVPRCVALRNKHLHYLTLRGGGANRKIALFWRKSSVRIDLMRELVDDLARDYTI